MVTQADSTTAAVAEGQSSATVYTRHHVLTPAEVQSWLPRSATPAQQDSMVQAHVRIAPITHWSNRPDTLHLPGYDKGTSVYDEVQLPQYYKESFFSKDSLFHPELPGGRQGVAGDPVPYTVAGDNLLTSLLLACFVLALVAFAGSGKFISNHLRQLFGTPRDSVQAATETWSELRFQIVLVVQTCLLLALLFFLITQPLLGDTYTISPYAVVGVYSAVFALYFALKGVAYAFVNWVFFPRTQNTQWNTGILFLTSMEGVLLFPAILLMAYFNMSLAAATAYTITVILLLKLVALYQAYVIFFRRNGAFLQIILYFCSLEIIPIVALLGILAKMATYFRVTI